VKGSVVSIDDWPRGGWLGAGEFSVVTLAHEPSPGEVTGQCRARARREARGENSSVLAVH
jgi:hypothetical protein